MRNSCFILLMILWIMNLWRAQVDSSLLGFLTQLQSDVVWIAVIWRFNRAACTSKVAQVAGIWCWLSSASSAGAVNQNTYLWPLQLGCLILLIWHLVSSRTSIPREPRGNCMALFDQTWEFTQYHCLDTPLMKAGRGHTYLKRDNIKASSW